MSQKATYFSDVTLASKDSGSKSPQPICKFNQRDRSAGKCTYTLFAKMPIAAWISASTGTLSHAHIICLMEVVDRENVALPT